MAKVLCIGTCYMPVKKDDSVVERYEDEWGDMRDLYDIPDNRLKEFMATRNFQEVVWDRIKEVFQAVPREG